MKKTLFTTFLILIIASCSFNESVKIDLTTGLSSKGSGLSCEDVYLTVSDEKVTRNVFTYGEVIEINFNGIEGFTHKGKEVFPGMKLLVLDKKGDTVLYNADLYADYTDPITKSPLLLVSKLTIGNPMRSNQSYTATVHLWDKKGKGTFDTKLEFSTVSNKSIKTTTNGLTANEVMLYNQEAGTPIVSDKIPYDSKITLVFDDLKGYRSENGICEFGLRMVISDNNGEVLLSEDDLLEGVTLDESEPNKQILGSFTLPSGVKGPIKLEVIVWDKIGTGKITSTATLELE